MPAARRIPGLILALAGAWLAGYALWLYWPDFEAMALALTFSGNFVAGLVFLAGGVFQLVTARPAPRFLYFDAIVVLTLVFVICVIFMDSLTTFDVLFVLHVVNPLLALGLWLGLVDHSVSRFVPTVLSGAVFPLVYFNLVILTGAGGYDFVDVDQQGIGGVLLFALGCLAALLATGALLLALNRLLHRPTPRESTVM
ncbi:MAG: hypothetical protein LBR27_02000 [Bifidobacteriaceae bacterium]|jgi:hypothetical protein|nr:hypothetical protein [Bifidobacteriaceae bacterium]